MNGYGDGTNWSSERGDGPGYAGSTGNAGNGGNGGSSSGKGGITTLKAGDSYTTPWGQVSIDGQGHAVMNGVVMTAENSSMVEDPAGGFTRVLNSLIGTPTTPQQNAGGKPSEQVIVENYLAGGSWAGTGPIDSPLINTAISDTLKNPMSGTNINISTTPSYKLLLSSFNTLPVGDQPSAGDQINQAWKKSYDAQPDQVRTSYETGGKNGHTVVGTGPNPTKKKLGVIIQRVNSDINDAFSQNQIDLQDALKFTADFYSTLTDKFGDKASELAQSFAEQAKGKKLRNVNDALNAFNNYQSSIASRFGEADRNAIANALKSADYSAMAVTLKRYSKALGYYGPVSDIVDVVNEVKKAFETNDWRPALEKIETIAAAKVATAAVAFSFAVITATPLGIIGYAVLMALVGALVDDNLISSINKYLGL